MYLEHVGGDGVQSLRVVGDPLQVGVLREDHLEYVKEELEAELVQEVNLCRI